MVQLSNKVLNLKESATLKMSALANKLKSEGVDIINLSLGEPDFNTPDYIKEAAILALKNNYTHYSPVPGFEDLREAICHKLKRDNRLSYEPNQIVVSTGAKQSIMNIILALINDGDEVVLPTPYWVSYKDMALFAGATINEIQTNIEDDFKMTSDNLRNSLSPESKLLIFSNPCNPSGSVYTLEELKNLAEVFKEFPDLVVVSDEIYEHINYQNEHTSLAEFSSVKEQVITVNGFSKGFAMTGWRLGYIAAPLEIAKACSKIQSQFTSGANSIAQKAAIAALLKDPVSTKTMKDEFLKRKKFFASELAKIPGFKVNDPQGAFYLFPDISEFFGKKIKGHQISSATDFSTLLLEEAYVACTPGEPFGNPNNIRFSYAASMEELKKAADNIKLLITNC